MRIGVLANQLAAFGGAEQHGLALIEPLIGIHDIDLLYMQPCEIDKENIQRKANVLLDDVRLVRLDSAWALPRITAPYDLFINVTYAGEEYRSAARKSILLVYFPLRIDDLERPSPFSLFDQQLQRLRSTILTGVDRLRPEIGARPFQDYVRAASGIQVASAMPFFALRKIGWCGTSKYRLARRSLTSYDVLLANSLFTQQWIRRRWHRDSFISYPPISADKVARHAKDKLILSVGRFEPEPNSKKQHILIRAFRQLIDEGVLREWRLVICGGSVDSRSEEVARELRRLANGYPVEVIENVSSSALLELYGQASLYWHAKGYGESSDEHPEYYEHFGMSTVEAMAAGAIPVVFSGGGQREIVTDRLNGFLWECVDELQKCVREVVVLPAPIIEKMRDAARHRARDFDRRVFRMRTSEIFRALNIACRD